MAEKLTETFVKALKPPPRLVADLGLRNHWFRHPGVHPDQGTSKGARTFVLSYWLNGTERRYRIGSWPNWSTLAARAEAREIRQRVDRGEDPAGDRRERREAPTLVELAERYKTEHLSRKPPQSRHDDGVMLGHILSMSAPIAEWPMFIMATSSLCIGPSPTAAIRCSPTARCHVPAGCSRSR